MTRRYTSEIVNEIGPEKDIPAPDVGTSPAVMAWIFDTFSMNQGYSVLSVVTGQAARGRRLARTRGGDRARRLLRARGDARAPGPLDRGARDRDPGLRERRLAVRAVRRRTRARGSSPSPTRAGGSATPSGLDVAALLAHKARGRRARRASPAARPITNEELLALPCDVLAPCALEHVLDEENASAVQAKIVLEGANGPTTPQADAILEEKRGARRSPTCSRTQAASSSRTSSGCRGCRSSSGPRRGQRAAPARSSRTPSARPGSCTRRAASRCGSAAYGLAVQRVAEASDDPRASIPSGRGHARRRARLPSLRAARERARRACAPSSASRSRRSTSPASPSSSAATASGSRWSRSTASGSPSTGSRRPAACTSSALERRACDEPNAVSMPSCRILRSCCKVQPDGIASAARIASASESPRASRATSRS